MAQTVIDARELVRSTTLNVEIRIINRRWVKFRLWIAARLCVLACWIGGMGLKMDESVGVLITEKPGELTKS